MSTRRIEVFLLTGARNPSLYPHLYHLPAAA